MKELFCYECGRLVATLVVGSRFDKGIKCFCPGCHGKGGDVPGFMKGLFRDNGLSKRKG
jgi:hypothetical protein